MNQREKLYELRNQKRANKVLRSAAKNKATIEPQYYKDILPEDRQEYENYFQRIWTIPLVHSERNTAAVIAFWKEILRRSYIASKSGTYKKHIIKYGDHPVQKFSLYTPLVKPKKPMRIALYVHGGFYINGVEEAFEYLGKEYVENGYMVATIGFRKLPLYTLYDAVADVHSAYLKLIQVLPEYGGDNKDMVAVPWSGGFMSALPPLFHYRDIFDHHFTQIVMLGPPSKFQASEHLKVGVAMFDHLHDTQQVYLHYYQNQGPLKQPIDITMGVKHLQFPSVYASNIELMAYLKEKGFNVTLTINQNHDHYDLSLDPHIAIIKMREFEIRRISPTNDLSRRLYQLPLDFKNELFKEFGDKFWNPQFNTPVENRIRHTCEGFKRLLPRLNSSTAKSNPLNHFLTYQTLGSIDPSTAALLIVHNTAASAILHLGNQGHRTILADLEAKGTPLTFALAQLGSETTPKQIGTTAEFDGKTKEWVLNTVTPFFQKYWVGGVSNRNLVTHAVVFAKTLVNKGAVAGVNPFLVPIADESGQPLKNILTQDLGEKIGVNGLQNGSISFDMYRVPKASLLDRITKVTDEGLAESQIKDQTERVGHALEQLGYWHLSISSAAFGVAKSALFVASAFSRFRWHLSENSKIQYPLSSFQAQQMALIPLITRGLSINFGLNYARKVFVESFGSLESTLLNNLFKVVTSDFAMTAVRTASESVGALGLSSYNRFNEYMATARTACSWAGDNRTLIMKIGKSVIDLNKQGKQLTSRPQRLEIGSPEELEMLTTLLDTVRLIEAAKFETLIKKYDRLVQQRRSTYDILTHFVGPEIFSFVQSMANRVCFQQSVEALRSLKEDDTKDLLELFTKTFAAQLIEADLTLLLTRGTFGANLLEKVREWHISLIRECGFKVEFLLARWNMSAQLLRVPIANSLYVKEFTQAVLQNTIRSRL